MTVRPLDLTDDALMARVYAVGVACRTFERPHVVPATEQTVVADLRHEEPGHTARFWGLWEGEELVGTISTWLPLLDNTDTLFGEVEVLPEHRRRGHGTEGIETIVAYAREHGRSRVCGDAFYPPERSGDHPYRVFLERNGFRPGTTEICRLLRLPVEGDVLDEIAEEARAAYEASYRVETYEQVPPALWPSLCDCMNRVATDAPTGELDWEQERLDPERYAIMLEHDRQTARERVTSLAVEQASGDVVAYTELVLPPGITRAHQWGTLVRAEHRGHRLGQAVKVASLRHLQERHPERADVLTSNAHDNPWMVSINERLGFRPVELLVTFYRTL